jgi:oxidase EvaA
MLRRSLYALNEGAKHTLESILRLVERRNSETAVDVKRVPLSMLDGWSADADGSLRHSSGKFFSVDGIEIETDRGAVRRWTQPVINQGEVGYLGLIAKDFDGITHFLMQLKIEPGNINRVQVSPTLQATRSNFRQAHGGRKPLYLDSFQNAAPHQIIVDQLQSEHGSRFFRKRNRNIVIMAADGAGKSGEIEEQEGFCWMTAGQLKALMRIDDMVNSPARSVFSLLDFGPPDEGRGLHSFGYLLSWLTGVKADSELAVRPYPLSRMTEWLERDGEIVHRDGKFFRVAGVRVSIAGREVTSWAQPVIVPVQRYLCAFIMKEINGILHFLVQAKLECGNYDGVELAPTVQCLTGGGGDGSESPLFDNVPYFDHVTGAKPQDVLYDSVQSEEGGRFYHDRNRYMLVRADGDFPEEEPPGYVWMTRQQIYGFLRFNNYVNAQARSLLAVLPYNWEET